MTDTQEFVITRKYLESLTFRPFENSDFLPFEGVESPVPLIAIDEENYWTVIIDGSFCDIYNEDCELVSQCYDICGLDYTND
jgi:hypothetical protein